MHDNLKLFSWLGYACAAVGLVSSLLTSANIGDRIVSILLAVIVAAVVWAASHGHRWVGWAFLVLTVLILVDLVPEVWAGAPSWMRFGEPFAKAKTLTMILDIIEALLAVAAAYVYFSRARLSGNARP